MTQVPNVVIPGKQEMLTRERGIELLRSNETLREELQKLREDNAKLTARLRDVETNRRVDRETRRAALNLMEDAVAARQAEQRENIERKRVERELRDADRRKDEFLATLAHELRNPLAPIGNSVQILRMLSPDLAASQNVCEMLDRQVNHMVRLVDDLMEVSRITRGRVDLHKERVELAMLMRNAVEMSKPLIESGRHKLDVRFPDEPLFLDADPVRLAQVIANLLNNAAKYTPEGGWIGIVADRDGNEAVVTVQDNGIGISSEMLRNVFDLFIQGDRVHGRAPGGLGIGLTLVRSLVRLHAGTVEAKSAGIGRGSEFVMRLPLATETLVNTSRNNSKPQKSMIPRCILVVDDNCDAATSLGTVLSFLGADVHLAHSGEAALNAVAAHHPSIVLLDIGMPEMDGHEVARRARQLPDCQNMTLIAVTGWGQEDDRRRSSDAGFDYHLVKPVDHEALHALLLSIPE